MHQPYPSSGQPTGPLPPPAPAPVLTAVKLMYAGAAVSAVELIIGLALIIVDITAAARGQFLGHSLTAPQMRPLIIALWIVFSLVVIALWLWMLRHAPYSEPLRTALPPCAANSNAMSVTPVG
jgi:lysylphosphatidylglycerol synthetase-like protein (DUF2156 family)